MRIHLYAPVAEYPLLSAGEFQLPAGASLFLYVFAYDSWLVYEGSGTGRDTDTDSETDTDIDTDTDTETDIVTDID